MAITDLQDQLFALEEQFWTQGGPFYRRHLASAAVMVFPEPTGVLVADEIVSSVDAAPRWTKVDLEEHRVLELDERSALVTYKATGHRPDRPPYVTRASSAYVHDGRSWRLAFHQQTPIG